MFVYWLAIHVPDTDPDLLLVCKARKRGMDRGQVT
jgi:hypothetical protein